ncbi:hypothetical protein [Okeania sp. SIO2B3]|uniref:hypothetical protein n=1 Tax=Okeania sp. SIO2B3 TaxID=2607784 RepID=UPI0013C29676|nr:hypothetical protein [Okeania sp. SIO2B3]NET46718.1 hypothetical protein [Okeania sp. SIO2B3]
MINLLIFLFIISPMIAPLRMMILAIIVLIKFEITHEYFLWAVLIAALFYFNLRSDNFVQSLLGHYEIGGGLIDFILISLLPSSLPTSGFRLGAISLAIILLCGFGGEHRQELANGFLAPAAFTISPSYLPLLLASAIACRSRSATAVISFAFIMQLRSRFLKLLVLVIAITVISLECYHRHHYISAYGANFWNAISNSRLWQWQQLPSKAVGIDGAISRIGTVKFHNAFVDFRVISGSWLLPFWWLCLVISTYQYLPSSILFSFIFVQFFWYNSSVILFGWFFLINKKRIFLDDYSNFY